MNFSSKIVHTRLSFFRRPWTIFFSNQIIQSQRICVPCKELFFLRISAKWWHSKHATLAFFLTISTERCRCNTETDSFFLQLLRKDDDLIVQVPVSFRQNDCHNINQTVSHKKLEVNSFLLFPQKKNFLKFFRKNIELIVHNPTKNFWSKSCKLTFSHQHEQN